MQHALAVGVRQSSGCLENIFDCLRDRQDAAASHNGRQVLAIDVLHHEEVNVLGLARVERGDHVGMNQSRGGLDLLLKTADSDFGFGQFGRQDLQGHCALHASMLRLVNSSHAAVADLVENDVVAQRQTSGLAPVNGLSLEFRELSVSVQQRGHFLAGGWLLPLGHLTEESLNFLLRHEAAVAKRLNELVEQDGHDDLSRATTAVHFSRHRAFIEHAHSRMRLVSAPSPYPCPPEPLKPSE